MVLFICFQRGKKTYVSRAAAEVPVVETHGVVEPLGDEGVDELTPAADLELSCQGRYDLILLQQAKICKQEGSDQDVDQPT